MTPPDGTPTLGEVVRRLEEVASRLQQLTDRLDTTYLRHDVYRAERRADEGRLAVIEGRLDEHDSDRTWLRRAAITSVAFPLLVTIIGSIILAVRP